MDSMMLRSLSVICNLANALSARRIARSAYMVITLAVTVAAWGILSSLAAQFVGTAGSQGSISDIAVRNLQRMQFVPVAYAHRIASLNGVRAVRYMDIAVFDCASGSVTLSVRSPSRNS